MQKYLFIRVLESAAALFVITLIVFSLSHLSGRPVDALLPEDATPQQIERLVREWGLDRPLVEQYLTFLVNALQGNFGESLKWRGMSAMDVVVDRLPQTLLLGGVAMLVTVAVAIPLGVVAAMKKNQPFDRFAQIAGLLGQSIPQFWLGIVLIWIFAVALGWLPTSGSGTWAHIVLPAVAMSWFQVAALSRLTRSAMLEVLDAEYIKLARVKMHGMAQAVGELTEQGAPAFEAAIPILSQLLKAETAEREVRSSFPAYRDLNGFDFASSDVNEALVRQLHRCDFLQDANNIVLVGGPGTGKTHIATAIGIQAIEHHHKRPLLLNRGTGQCT